MAIACGIGFYGTHRDAHGRFHWANTQPADAESDTLPYQSKQAQTPSAAKLAEAIANLPGDPVAETSASLSKPQVNTASDPLLDIPQVKKALPQLRLDSERYYVEGNFCNVVGQVTNISNAPLDSVQVITTFYDKKGAVVELAEAMLAISPIKPGQSSPFHTLETASPLIAAQNTKFLAQSGLVGVVTSPELSTGKKSLDTKPDKPELAAATST